MWAYCRGLKWCMKWKRKGRLYSTATTVQYWIILYWAHKKAGRVWALWDKERKWRYFFTQRNCPNAVFFLFLSAGKVCTGGFSEACTYTRKINLYKSILHWNPVGPDLHVSVPVLPRVTSPKFFWENERKGNSLVLRMAFSFHPVTYWARAQLKLMNYILVDFFVSRLPSLVVLPSVPHAEESRTTASSHGLFSLLDWRTSLTLFFNFQALLFVWFCHMLWELLIEC